MKKVLFKIMSVFLAVLLLVVSTSWKVEKHYCMGHLVDVSFFDTLESCGMDSVSDSCDLADKITKPSCCEDVKVILEGQDVVSSSVDSLTIESGLFLFAFAQSFADLFTGLEKKIVPYKNYDPPILVCDIALRDQTFLI